MSFAWTQAGLDALYRLYVLEGRGARDAAQTLGGGLTRNAVLGKALHLGWKRGKAGPPSPVTPPPAPPGAAQSATPRPWIERRRGECAFPVGEPVKAELQLSCCAPVRGGGAYCPAHQALMVLPNTTMTEKEALAILEIARRAA